MEENGRSAKARDQRNEMQELIARCKAMEKELDELRQRIGQIQSQVESALKRREQDAD